MHLISVFYPLSVLLVNLPSQDEEGCALILLSSSEKHTQYMRLHTKAEILIVIVMVRQIKNHYKTEQIKAHGLPW